MHSLYAVPTCHGASVVRASHGEAIVASLTRTHGQHAAKAQPDQRSNQRQGGLATLNVSAMPFALQAGARTVSLAITTDAGNATAALRGLRTRRVAQART
jgi:hypothetical protein